MTYLALVLRTSWLALAQNVDQGEAQSDRQLCLMRRAMDLG